MVAGIDSGTFSKAPGSKAIQAGFGKDMPEIHDHDNNFLLLFSWKIISFF